MSVNKILNDIASQVIDALQGKDIIIQRYNSYSSSSIYLKFDYGVLNSLRISDHPGKQGLCYRYNLILGHEKTIEEEKYMRYYFNENTVNDLINTILFDRIAKIQKYGYKNYRSFMNKNLNEKGNTTGFWAQAKVLGVVENKTQDNSQSNAAPYETYEDKDNGVIAYGPPMALKFYREAALEQKRIDSQSKFPPGTKVKACVPFEKLVKFYMKKGGENNTKARISAMVLTKPGGGYEIGEVIGNTICDDGIKYLTIEFPLSPMTFLPEEFFELAY